jgi:hypothetical protein
LGINLKTAKALGLTVPDKPLVAADESAAGKLVRSSRWMKGRATVSGVLGHRSNRPECPQARPRPRQRAEEHPCYGEPHASSRLAHKPDCVGRQLGPTDSPARTLRSLSRRQLRRTTDRMIRRECVDHVIVLGEAHLRRILQAYARYYNDLRTHRSLDKDAPFSRPVQRIGSITSQALLGGLRAHHRSCGKAFFRSSRSRMRIGLSQDPLSD